MLTASQSQQTRLIDSFINRGIKNAVRVLCACEKAIYIMQKIKLNDRFDLCYDAQGNKWIEEKKVSQEKGRAYKETYCGYHWHFEHLLNSFAQHRLPEKTAATVKGALKAIAEVENEIQDLAKELGEKLDDEFEKVRDMR